jgi:hypothetical protein
VENIRQKDPEYNAENERKYLQKVIYENLPKPEKQRMDFLSKDLIREKTGGK